MTFLNLLSTKNQLTRLLSRCSSEQRQGFPFAGEMKYYSFSPGYLTYIADTAHFSGPLDRNRYIPLYKPQRSVQCFSQAIFFFFEKLSTPFFESGKKIKSTLRKSIPNLKHGFHRENRENTSPKSLLRKKHPLTKISEGSGDEFP